jgi:hypothetical protein
MIAGSVNGSKYNITLDLGVEQLTQDKKVWDYRYQLWHVSCSSPWTLTAEKFPFNTWCSVNRIVLDKGFAEGRVITGHNHYIEEGTLKLTNIDFPNGKLDFQLTFTDMSTIDVMIRLKRWENVLFLDSFKAIGVSRGSLSDTLQAVEFRIPTYSYVMNIPVEMPGLKSTVFKEIEDFENSLAPADRQIWSRIQGKNPIFSSEVLKQYIPDYDKIGVGEGKRPLRASDIPVMEKGMRESLAKWLPTTGMSLDGQTKTKAYITPSIDSMIESMREELKVR